MDSLTQKQTETAARLLADAYRLSEIARAMRVPLAVIEAWHHSYHSEPQWGDPSPEEIAERAAALKAGFLARMQAGGNDDRRNVGGASYGGRR